MDDLNERLLSASPCQGELPRQWRANQCRWRTAAHHSVDVARAHNMRCGALPMRALTVVSACDLGGQCVRPRDSLPQWRLSAHVRDWAHL